MVEKELSHLHICSVLKDSTQHVREGIGSDKGAVIIYSVESLKGKKTFLMQKSPFLDLLGDILPGSKWQTFPSGGWW